MAPALADSNGISASGRNILVVEDEYWLAEEARLELESLGAHVVGPAASLEAALRLVQSETVDLALLDIRVQDEDVFPVAQALLEAGVPFVFVTGYDAFILPEQFRHIRRFTKPADYRTVIQALCASSSPTPDPLHVK